MLNIDDLIFVFSLVKKEISHMEKEVIVKLHADFEHIVQVEEETGIEFWLARDLQVILGYTKWDNFTKVIDKAKISCKTAGYNSSDHFLDVGKMIS